jgi:deoxyribonuclease V
MHACLDASYREGKAAAACVLFCDWRDERSAGDVAACIGNANPYIPGWFFLRELPALLAILKKVTTPLDVLVIDGYVWLDACHSPGLGAHLYESRGRGTPVIGVAKSRYRGAPALEIIRGKGRRPLYISAAGMEVEEAAERIRVMHGPYRIPTLLRRADELSRRMQDPHGCLDIPSAAVL